MGPRLREAVADFLDDLRWARGTTTSRSGSVDRPRDVDPRTDAYLGALAEHIAAERALPRPPWSTEAGRFLVRIWWPRYPGLVGTGHCGIAAAFRSAGHPAGCRNVDPGVAMSRDEILQALTALGADLAERGLVADLYVVGGAAIALAYDERRATRDIEAVFAPKNEVYAAAARVGATLDLPKAGSTMQSRVFCKARTPSRRRSSKCQDFAVKWPAPRPSSC